MFVLEQGRLVGPRENVGALEYFLRRVKVRGVCTFFLSAFELHLQMFAKDFHRPRNQFLSEHLLGFLENTFLFGVGNFSFNGFSAHAHNLCHGNPSRSRFEECMHDLYSTDTTESGIFPE